RRPYNFIEGEYPIFFESAKGGKVIDVDGNEYIDMLCAYGPIIIGHREEEIDNAVIKQIHDKGFCMSLTQRVQNELAKKLKELIPCCEKLVLMKMGTDATTAAIRVARAYTKKEKVLSCGYHGWYDDFSEVHGIEAGIPKKLYEDFYEFEFNNLEEIETLFKKHKNEISAIMVNPIHTPGGREVEMPKPGFLEGLRKLATENNALLIYDEIRTGFRVDMGGAQKMFGVVPDLAAFGKAMGNGYPISTLVGKAEFMNVLVEKVFLSSTFFPNSLAQIAALKTIELLERENVLDNIRQKGNQFAKQVKESIEDSGVPCIYSGEPWMPYITFTPDKNLLYKKLREQFYRQLIRRKVFLQPFHHGYICHRHSEDDINFAANMIDESLKETRKLL
ncbi:MAG: aminotransferase class III-fold pyridoxal phosphate-dependent enzyme, partial [Candidatus Lokiarchaeota archaeon]|nr:aminotransferase class III-fold pyridoxal phosphate-dependent enzyme [Candidatus Lokiarchaeota archaeon]